MNAALAIQKPILAPLEFSADQRKIILNSFLSGATEAEASVLLELARLRRLNPITKEIHFVKRWDTEKNTFVWSAQVGIDGFRTIAERTGLYDGQDEAEFGYSQDGKQLLWCKVRIWRKDWSRPAVGLAHFREFAQYKKDGKLTRMWETKEHVMLAKCAEAQGHRKAFPGDTSGLYAPEEMPDPEAVGTISQIERSVNPTPPQPALQPVNGAPSSSQTDKVAAKVKAATEKAKGAAPRLPTAQLKVTFGPSKGKLIGDLTVGELNAAISFGEEKLAEAPSADWAASLAAALADLKDEHGTRIEKAIETEAAEKEKARLEKEDFIMGPLKALKEAKNKGPAEPGAEG